MRTPAIISIGIWLLVAVAHAQQAAPVTGPLPAAAADELAAPPPAAAADVTTAPPGADSAPADPAPPGAAPKPSAPEAAAPPAAPIASVPEPAPAAAPPAALEASTETDLGSDVEADAMLDDQAESEIARLLGEEGSGTGPSLRLYGFTDFTFRNFLMSEDNPYSILFERSSTFFIGNLNLYLDAQISDDFRSLAEVRFLYLPNGTTTQSTPEGAPRTDTFASDYADVNRNLRWGGVEIERVWLDYTPHPLLTIRAGQYLTPYGIWNVDHGSPVVVSTRRPYIVGEELFPERQTGLQLYGAWAAGGSATLGYHFTFSNGRGPVDSYKDLDDNKALGGRAFVEFAGPARVTLGGSVYHGRYTDKRVEAEFVSTTDISSKTEILTQYDETALALDAKLEYSGFLLQGEFIHNQRRYTDEGRPSTAGPFGAGSAIGYVADTVRLGTYGLIGYRIAAIDLMPYVYLEYIDLTGVLLPDVMTSQLGLNYSPLAAVVAKVQFTWAKSPNAEGVLADDAITGIEMQIAWAF